MARILTEHVIVYSSIIKTSYYRVPNLVLDYSFKLIL